MACIICFLLVAVLFGWFSKKNSTPDISIEIKEWGEARDWRDDPVTPKQLRYVEWLCKQTDQEILNVDTKGEAHDYIDEILEERPELAKKWRRQKY